MAYRKTKRKPTRGGFVPRDPKRFWEKTQAEEENRRERRDARRHLEERKEG